jgi:xylulokinase
VTSESRPREEQFVLSVDLGTSGLKVGLVSLVGRIVWFDHHQLRTRRTGNSVAVQDAEEWWQLVVAASRRGLATSSIDNRQVVAVCVTGQWSSTVPVDSSGSPVGDCMMWMDTRGGPMVRRVIGDASGGVDSDAVSLWRRHTGMAPSTSGSGAFGNLMFLCHGDSEVARRARWFLEPVDYLSMRFTGVASASSVSMMGSLLFDFGASKFGTYDQELLERSGIGEEKLPPLTPFGSIIGEVQETVASEIGLMKGTLVLTGLPDLHSAIVGTGSIGDYEPYVALSTTSWISCVVDDRRLTSSTPMATVPGLFPDRYLIVNNQNNAARCLEWLCDSIISPNDGLFVEPGRAGIEQLLDLAADVDAGSGDVIFTPWLAGERPPIDNDDARAGFHNLSLSTSRAHLVRAVLEGVAYNSRLLFEDVERFTERRLEPIRIIGGGAQSMLWCQIMADVLNRKVEQVSQPLLASLRGAAIFTGMMLGQVRQDEVRHLVEVDREFVPDQRNRKVYDRLFYEFPLLHEAQSEMFARLNRDK